MFASVVREGSYSTLRIGSYEPLKQLFGARDVAHTPLWKKVVAGAISGSMASLVTSPIDIVKVRLQAEGKLTGKLNIANKLVLITATIKPCLLVMM